MKILARQLQAATLALSLLACRSSVTVRAPRAQDAPSVLPVAEPGVVWTTRNHFRHLTFQNPVFAVMPPRDPRRWFVGEREGRVFAVPHDEETTRKTLVLDLSGKTLGWQDCGLLNLVFHPEFGQAGSPNRGYIYVWYNHTDRPHPGPDHPFHGHLSSNRLTRFTIPDGATAADPGSALVLIDQPRDNTDHQGGGMFFHPEDGFLYIGVGDGGHPVVPDAVPFAIRPADDPQRIDRNLLSGVLRIDVDRRGGAVSHPIRRQPKAGRTQGYFVPNDNPWVDPTGGALEEFFAIGLRNPHRLTYDPRSRRIFAGEVGAGRWEEIDVIERGANYEWNYLEAAQAGPVYARPAKVLGAERGPLHAYRHEGFAAVIGGVVYRGRALPELQGQYLFGDLGNGRIWALDAGAAAPVTSPPMLLRLPQEMAAYGGLSSFAVDADGEVYLCVLGDNQHGTGTLRKLVRAPVAERPMPTTLSETRLFKDVASLTPASQLLPYEVNAPFWSDHKVKTRWLSVPPDARIGFRADGEWTFPPGTVAVKHFDLQVDARDPAKRRRLETRVVVMDAQGGAYGRTYKWRADQREADLLTGAVTEHLTRRAKAPFGPLQAALLGGAGEGLLRAEGDTVALVSPEGGTTFAHVALAGDFDFAVELREVAGGTAGVMLRGGVDGDGPELFVGPAPGGRWVRVARTGKALEVFTGDDGQLWTPLPISAGDVAWVRHGGVAVRSKGGASRATLSAPFNCEVRDHHYPSGDECMACHNASAHYVLGASTRQWNRAATGPDGPTNQLVLASRRGFFDTSIAPEQPAGWKRLAALDDRTASLEDRARSYLDANCAQCHRPGNVVQVSLDARYDTPLERQGLLDGPVRWPRAPNVSDRIVAPGNPGSSRLYRRVTAGSMPPLGSVIRNEEAGAVLKEWITGLK